METKPEERQRNPWLWVPSLYFSEGIPYAIVIAMSVLMYKDLGIPNAKIAYYTSWLNLPWVLKPLWSPYVDITRTKRFWIVAMQFVVAVVLTIVGLVLSSAGFFAWSLTLFFVMAIASATHDIAADGFYMLSLPPHEQALWVGMRSAFYRVATIFGSGVLVMLAGSIEKRTGAAAPSWMTALLVAASVFLFFSFWHRTVLPNPAADVPVRAERSVGADFLLTFRSFFQKPGVGMALAFILLYRFDEAQLGKIGPLFLRDARSAAGLGLETAQIGFITGTCGVLALTCGGLLGGFAAAKYGLRKMIPLMLGFMYLPKLAYIFLAYAQPDNFVTICGAVAFEQFGYGVGFVAFMLYLLYFSNGPHQTAHYAICTGFMALGLAIPGAWSGWLSDRLGYKHFFVWIFWSAIPGLIVTLRLKLDPHFGRK